MRWYGGCTWTSKPDHPRKLRDGRGHGSGCVSVRSRWQSSSPVMSNSARGDDDELPAKSDDSRDAQSNSGMSASSRPEGGWLSAKRGTKTRPLFPPTSAKNSPAIQRRSSRKRLSVHVEDEGKNIVENSLGEGQGKGRHVEALLGNSHATSEKRPRRLLRPETIDGSGKTTPEDNSADDDRGLKTPEMVEICCLLDPLRL